MDPYIGIEFQPPEESQQPNSGLLRFRSAPSSLFANFMDTLDKEDTDNTNKVYNNCNNNQESENFMSTYMSNGGGEDSSSSGISFDGLESKPSVIGMQSVGNNSHQLLPPQYPKQQQQQQELLVRCGSGSISMAMDQSVKVVNGSNLSRQSSSPAGFFAHLNSHNGMNGSGMFRGNGGVNGESSPRTASRLRGPIDFNKSSHRSCIGNLPRIPEVGDETIKDTTTHENGDVKFRNGDQDDMRLFSPGFSFNSWSTDSSRLSEDIPAGFRGTNDHKVSYPAGSAHASLAQNGEFSSPAPRVLSHHLSLPNTSAEIAAMDKLLPPFQDTVPCKIRAKRGCATHPRSIAERARRTRISERMKKLQDLVPNMDKQMNTSDMLDLAVDYIKDLQRQHKSLSDLRSRCRCLNT